MTDGNENYISSANDAYDEPIPDDEEHESFAINKQELSPSKRKGQQNQSLKTILAPVTE